MSTKQTMIEYVIVNPSDTYMMKAGNMLHAAAAIFLLGKGKYPLKSNGNVVVPFFLLGGFEDWWSEHSPNTDFGTFVREERFKVADALDTVSMPTGHERSSMNDIGRDAIELAKKLRAPANDG